MATKKWKLNRTLLASKIGLSKGSFNNKFSETGTYKFTDQEKEDLKKILSLDNSLKELNKRYNDHKKFFINVNNN